MTAERWQRVKKLFETARQAPPSDRERLLLDSGDLDLAREVRVLLDASDQSSGFLEEPALASHAQVVADRIPAPFVGTRVGAYLITRQVGEGGMGVVYEGVRADGQFEQTVAIKILKRWMLSEVDISRFRAERQILADLDHPNIARLLDGGTTPDGLPYYAMEFVEGEFVDVFCRDRSLSVTQRLELFRKVCDAVEYAHQRGVIHRDLKPANILVTATGTPKLLDFGIAKVQENGAATPRTATLNRVATPLYASPEQLRGDPIAPASDIYSLGVLLYVSLGCASCAHRYFWAGDANFGHISGSARGHTGEVDSVARERPVGTRGIALTPPGQEWGVSGQAARRQNARSFSQPPALARRNGPLGGFRQRLRRGTPSTRGWRSSSALATGFMGRARHRSNEVRS